MTTKYRSFTLDKLFKVKSGDYHATKELDPGDIPLISCGVMEQGLVGFFDFNLVTAIFGSFSKWIYGIVGISAVYYLIEMFMKK